MRSTNGYVVLLSECVRVCAGVSNCYTEQGLGRRCHTRIGFEGLCEHQNRR